MDDRMMCTWCCTMKRRPEDFPSTMYAVCDVCYPQFCGDVPLTTEERHALVLRFCEQGRRSMRRLLDKLAGV